MPMGEYEDFDACVAANSDKTDPDAYCAAIKRQIEGAAALSESEQEAIRASEDFGDKMLEEDPCWEDYVMVGTKTVNGQEVPNCVPEDEADAADMAQLAAADDRCGEGAVQIGDRCVQVNSVGTPASLLGQPRVMASASPLDTQPIEREELGDDTVAYRGLKLIDSGVWTDSNSETPTLYDDRTFENTDPEFNGDRDGPPVNIAHDLHKDGPNAGEPHEASIGGYIDPKSLDTDGEALFGDVILDRSTDAGAFADTNLKSALENDGTAGFSPSVELMPTELRDAEHPRAEEYVAGAELTGLGLVRDPASKSVDLRQETQNRAVAMAASGNNAKALYLQEDSMSDGKQLMNAEEVREIMARFGLEVEGMDDEELMDMAEDMHEDLMDQMADGEEDEDEEDEQEMGDYGDDEEEDDEQEMADGEDMAALQDQVASLAQRLEDLEDAMSDTLSEGDVEDTKSELSAATDEIDDLREDKKELSERVKTLEEQPTESKTLAEESNSEDFDWSDADDGITHDPATGSMSR